MENILLTSYTLITFTKSKVTTNAVRRKSLIESLAFYAKGRQKTEIC